MSFEDLSETITDLIGTAKQRMAELKEATALAEKMSQERDELLEALQEVLVMWRSPQPTKLDEALTWRQNDERALSKAQAAIAKANLASTNTSSVATEIADLRAALADLVLGADMMLGSPLNAGLHRYAEEVRRVAKAAISPTARSTSI